MIYDIHIAIHIQMTENRLMNREDEEPLLPYIYFFYCIYYYDHSFMFKSVRTFFRHTQTQAHHIFLRETIKTWKNMI